MILSLFKNEEIENSVGVKNQILGGNFMNALGKFMTGISVGVFALAIGSSNAKADKSN